jgi:hypothetical protein
MKKMLVFIILGSSWLQAEAQVNQKNRTLLNFFRMKPAAHNYQWSRKAPAFAVIPAFNQPDVSYWQGSTYTSYSENGRLRSTHSFDVQGQLRETRASFSLKKSGVLSWWRIQFSSQRNRPQFIYTIH